MNDDDMIVNPGDSISNKGSGPLEDCLQEIKELEREKNKGKEKTPLPQSIIFTILGILSCFLSYIEASLTSSIFYSYKNKNIDKSKLFLEDIKYISLFIISLIIIGFKIKKPEYYQIILPFLYCFISYSSTYLFSRNVESFILLSKVLSLVFVCIFFSINNILKVKDSHLYTLPTKVYIGLLLAIVGIIIELLSSYFLTNIPGDDNIRFIYHYNDFRNYAISLAYGICYAAIIIILDIFCKSLEVIFDTLFYIGSISSIICFILSLCYSEIPKITSTFHDYGSVNNMYFLLCIALFLFNIIFQSILIKKCSIYSVGIIISSQISIRVIVDIIIYDKGSNSNIFTIISMILCFIGLFIICLYYISNRHNEKKKEISNTESFASNKDKTYNLINPVYQTDD